MDIKRRACGHELLTIIIRFALILLSTLDPSSAIFISRKRNKNMLPLSTEARKQNFLLSRRKNDPLSWVILTSASVLPPGIEPGVPVPQTNVLSIKLREQTRS